MAPKISRDKLDLIDDLLYKSKKPKQALKELEKWLKKMPGSAQLQILKAQSLLECHRYEESRAVCKDIAHQTDVVNDLHLINDLHFLRFRHQKLLSQDQLSSEPDIIQLWQNAAKAQKSKTGVLLQWYGIAVSCDHWEDAQLAMAGLRKEHPSEPNYSFYYIAITHMLAELQNSSDLTRSKLNSTLAYRLLEAAFTQNLSKQEKPNNKSSLTSQSLDLLIHIYMAQHRQEELLSLLENPKLQKLTEIGMNSWRVLRIKLQLLEDRQHWERLHSLAVASIWLPERSKSDSAPNMKSAKYTNHDLLIFKALVKSVEEINDNEKLKETMKLLIGLQFEDVPFFSKRNASIALMNLLIDIRGDRGIIEKLKACNLEVDSLFSACLRHYQQFGHHACCFGDIRKPVSELTVTERDSYMREVKIICKKRSSGLVSESHNREWLVMETNCLKLEYLLQISQPHLTDTNSGLFDAFLANAFSVLRISRSLKQHLKRDLYHIIVLAMLRRSLSTSNETHQKNSLFMQIACLLESSQRNETDDRQVLLLLARLYSCLGFGSHFIHKYQKLRIKDILNEPLAHVLYTRISLSHPFPISTIESGTLDENARDPSIGAARIIDKSASAIETVNRLISNTHKTPVYNRLSEYSDLKRKLNGSRTKQIIVIERRRISRLRDEQCDENDLHETDTWLRYRNDERDLTCSQNYGETDNSALGQLLQNGPPPQDYWIAMMMLWDETYSCLLGESTFRTADLNLAEGIVKGQERSHDLTDGEREVLKGWLLLRDYVKSQMLGGGDLRVVPMTELLFKIVDFAEVVSERICSWDYSPGQIPDGTALQEIYLALEYLKACSKIGKFHQSLPKFDNSVKQNIPTREQINAKMKDIQIKVDKLRLFISSWRAALSKKSISSLAERIQSGPFSDHLRELIGPEMSESYAKTFLENAKDALDGILKAAKF